MKYLHVGFVQIHLVGIGTVDPGEIIETDVPIDHPEFELQEDEKKPKKNTSSKSQS